MGGAEGGVVECDVDRDLGVRTGLGTTALGRPRAHAAKEHVEDVLDRTRAEGIARADVGSEAVVVGASIGVREDLVGLGHLFESRLGVRVTGIGVGVVLTSETSIGLLQIVR